MKCFMRFPRPDDSFSLEPADRASLCRDSKSPTAWSTLGKVDYGRKSSEQGNAQFRRLLYFAKNLKLDDVITEDSIRSVRLRYGLSPKYFYEVIGKAVKRKIKTNSPVTRNAQD